MQKRVPHGTKASPEVSRELLSAERGGRLQHPVVGPAVVFVEQVNVIFSHGGGRWPTLFWGILRYPRCSAKPETKAFSGVWRLSRVQSGSNSGVPAKRETGLRPDGDVGNMVLSEDIGAGDGRKLRLETDVVLSEPVAKRGSEVADSSVMTSAEEGS